MIPGCLLRAAGSAAGWVLSRALKIELRMPTEEELDELLAEFVAAFTDDPEEG